MKPLAELSQRLSVTTFDYKSGLADKALTSAISAVKETSTLSDRVTISAQGQQQLEDEASSKIAATLHKGQQTAETTKESATKSIDDLIEELQQKIRELMQQIAQLKAKGDEGSVEQSKSLEVQLSVLNAQLMELMNQKLKEAKTKS